ncbi:hypothetical protein INT44_001957 [Umbelopsis vinacea]|uniref:Uncharacterized protein n=1 Tax=Umbelopsis vinacea TaxID=44442 RepID=A0A8H7UKK2_9FUNG|nr:hypothetical protein INT44_001957 [Umbelopsis vinacea]
MRSAIDQLTDQLETTGQQVSYLRNRLLRIESSNLLLLDGIKSAVVNTTSPEDEEFPDWQEDRYIRIRQHLQQLINQAEATLVSTGQEDTLSSELNDHTCNSLLVRDADDRPGQDKIAHEFNALMKVVDGGDTVCALCHVKSKRQEPKNFLAKLSSKLGIPHEIVMAICKTMPYLARHAFSAFTILTALIPAVRAILGRRGKKGGMPKPRITTVNRTKTAIISEVVYFAIMFITYTREIFGSDGTFSSIISRGKELWHIITSDAATKEIEDANSSSKKRELILCNFGSLINKLYAFIETNERNEKNVKKVVSNTVKVESLVGKLTQASKSSSSPIMHMATMFIYAAGLVGAWEVSKRATTSI